MAVLAGEASRGSSDQLLYKNRNSFHFKHLFFGLINNYFMVYYFKVVVRHYVKQMEIQITI